MSQFRKGIFQRIFVTPPEWGIINLHSREGTNDGKMSQNTEVDLGEDCHVWMDVNDFDNGNLEKRFLILNEKYQHIVLHKDKRTILLFEFGNLLPVKVRTNVHIGHIFALKEFIDDELPKKGCRPASLDDYQPPDPLVSWLVTFISNSESTVEYTSETLHYHYNRHLMAQNLPVIPTARSFGMLFKNRFDLAKWGIVRRRSHGQGYYRFNSVTI